MPSGEISGPRDEDERILFVLVIAAVLGGQQ